MHMLAGCTCQQIAVVQLLFLFPCLPIQAMNLFIRDYGPQVRAQRGKHTIVLLTGDLDYLSEVQNAINVGFDMCLMYNEGTASAKLLQQPWAEATEWRGFISHYSGQHVSSIKLPFDDGKNISPSQPIAAAVELSKLPTSDLVPRGHAVRPRKMSWSSVPSNDGSKQFTAVQPGDTSAFMNDLSNAREVCMDFFMNGRCAAGDACPLLHGGREGAGSGSHLNKKHKKKSKKKSKGKRHHQQSNKVLPHIPNDAW